MTESEKELAVQVNGKLKTTVVVPADADDETVREAVLREEKIQAAIKGMEIVRTIIVKNKLVNLVVRPAK